MAIKEVPASHGATNASPPSNPSAHAVQFYFDDHLLIDELTRLIGTTLVSGDVAIVIATQAHREALARELQARDLDTTRALAEGRFASLDAADTLSRIMLNQMPDPERFSQTIGGLITRARAAAKSGQSGIVIFGEMVALLWAEEKQQAAIRLEELWSTLATKYCFSLRCAYPMNGFHKKEHAESFAKICAEHSAVLPLGSRALVLSDEERLRTIAALQQRLKVLEYENTLRETERRFRMLVEAVQDYAIFTLDADGHVNSWNVGAERLKGYKTDEILGQHFSVFYPAEDIADGKPQRELSIAVNKGRVEDEGWRIRKDGSRFWANVVITASKDPHGGVIGFSKVTRDFTERMQAQKALQDSQRQLLDSEKSLRKLSFHLLRTQDEERRRIGRDLHDSLGQYLSVLKMKLDGLRSAPGKLQPNHLEELNHCAQITEDAVKEVRTISYLLYPPMLEEMGLHSAISWYLDGFTKRSGIQTTFDVSPALGRLSPDVELAIFRILQESLTNVHRHSGSPTAAVRLSLDDNTFVLEVSDQGKGTYLGDTHSGESGEMDSSSQDCVGGLGVGLRGMRERMRQIDGKLEFRSSPSGTTVTATVPIKNISAAYATP
jgi:PAS domain S-box-containing protein